MLGLRSLCEGLLLEGLVSENKSWFTSQPNSEPQYGHHPSYAELQVSSRRYRLCYLFKKALGESIPADFKAVCPTASHQRASCQEALTGYQKRPQAHSPLFLELAASAPTVRTRVRIKLRRI